MLALDIPTSTLCATLLCLIVLYARHSVSYRSRLPLPPGPPKLPIIGNLFNAPTTFPWETYCRQDSDIIHLNVLGMSVIVLSSLGARETLLQKRTYSDRQPMLIDLMGWGFNFGIPQIVEVTNALLRRLLDAPDAFMAHFRMMTGEFVMSVAYGIDVRSSDDPYIYLARDALHSFNNTFPIIKHVLRWLPGAGFKRYAEGRKLARACWGSPPALFTYESSHALENSDTLFYQERHVQATAATMYIGGADTSVSSFGTFVLAMLANPEAQRKAQAEIDCITGGKVLPGFDDNGRLPYITVIVQEILCWKNCCLYSLLPAVPRFLVEEDEYRGYRLPAGSLGIPNTWAILHGEFNIMYPDPYVFNPDRFLLDGELHPAGTLPEVAFGYGRRVCPGRYIATSKLWIVVASVLAAFDIRKATDKQGNIVEPSYEYGSALLSMPLPFKCITPRSTEAAALIRATVP
ncbi:cytochrome P450 [Mycena leptocephala]|nr:cytochrome P450 [Mycena leptocephala]